SFYRVSGLVLNIHTLRINSNGAYTARALLYSLKRIPYILIIKVIFRNKILSEPFFRICKGDWGGTEKLLSRPPT
ncbi:TPA: hypothetical protein ACX5GE_001610, partial [Neisseria meningitidis]|uniref:hypothetical protein n=1 Tax=Neisseria meningitidis TaxID=487 RepID=UPI003988B86B